MKRKVLYVNRSLIHTGIFYKDSNSSYKVKVRRKYSVVIRVYVRRDITAHIVSC